MLGRFTKEIFKFMINLSHSLRLSPFKWNPDREEFIVEDLDNFKVRNIKIHLFGFKLMSCLMLFNFAFGGCRVIQSLIFLNLTGQENIFQFVIFGVSSLITSIQLTPLIYPYETASLFSTLMKLDATLTKNYQVRKAKDSSERLIMIIGSCGALEIPGLVILYLANSSSPVYFFSIRNYLAQGLRKPLKYIGILYEATIALSTIIIALSYAFFFISFLNMIAFWISEASPKEEESEERVTSDKFRSPETACKTYRTFQTLMTQLNYVASSIVMPGQHAVTALLLILCIFSTIQYYDPNNFRIITEFTFEAFNDLACYIVFPLGIVIFAVWIGIIHPKAGKLIYCSQNFKESWRTELIKYSYGYGYNNGLKLNKVVDRKKGKLKFKSLISFKMNPVVAKRQMKELFKFFKSCQDLRTNIGSFFFYQVSSTAELYDTVIDNTANLLITYR